MTAHEEITSWVNEYGDELYRWAHHKTLDKELARDLVQETFLSATRSFNSFKRESSPKTWLFRILNNRIIDYYRSAQHNASKRTEVIDEKRGLEITDGFFNASGWTEGYQPPDWDEDIHLLDNPDFLKVFYLCIDDLPEKWRTAITAKFLIEKSADEVCKELQITPSNYWQIIHRAKLLLKKCLEANWAA